MKSGFFEHHSRSYEVSTAGKHGIKSRTHFEIGSKYGIAEGRPRQDAVKAAVVITLLAHAHARRSRRCRPMGLIQPSAAVAQRRRQTVHGEHDAALHQLVVI